MNGPGGEGNADLMSFELQPEVSMALPRQL